MFVSIPSWRRRSRRWLICMLCYKCCNHVRLPFCKLWQTTSKIKVKWIVSYVNIPHSGSIQLYWVPSIVSYLLSRPKYRPVFNQYKRRPIYMYWSTYINNPVLLHHFQLFTPIYGSFNYGISELLPAGLFYWQPNTLHYYWSVWNTLYCVLYFFTWQADNYVSRWTASVHI